MGFFSGIINAITGKSGARAAKKAGRLKSEGSQDAADLFGPSVQAGTAARNRVLSLLGLEGGDGAEFQFTPGAQLRFNQGIRALESSGAARGMLNSGATAKALTRFGQDFASNERAQEINRLLALTGAGDAATSQQAPFVFGVKGGKAEGILNAAQARAQGANNLLGLGGFLLGKTISPGGLFNQ